MKSDLYTPSAPLTGKEIDEVKQLVPHHFNRTRAERFALETCIFLAFEDPHVETSHDTKGKGVDSEGSAASRNAATTSNTWFPDNHDHDNGSHTGTSSSEQSLVNPNFTECGCTKSPPDKVCSPSKCEICCGVPEFPSHGNVRTLRQVRSQEYFQSRVQVPLCPHFLAVSYCRNDQTNFQAAQHYEHPHQSYQIRNLDGTLRKNRAPNHIIDKAIAVCRVVGYKLIWIDQESFVNESYQNEGDGRDSKLETASDWNVLFRISHKTAGLLSVEISCPEELEALGFLLDNCNTMRSLDESRRSEVVYHAANLFSRISQDSWYTCGSTIREAISAEGNLVLVIQS